VVDGLPVLPARRLDPEDAVAVADDLPIMIDKLHDSLADVLMLNACALGDLLG
jgi:hypothetical protein